MNFGDRLAATRKAKKLTQDQLGLGLGTDGANATKAVVVGWEKGRHFPRVDQLVLICDKLGVTSDYLLFGRVESSQTRPEVQEIADAFSKLNEAQIKWAMRGIRFALEAAPLRGSTTRDAAQPDEVEKVESPSSRRMV